MTDVFNIAHVEQTTGISKELLRMWERRYGYPQPARDAQGDRVYTSADIIKLGLIRQLMEQGQRPGKLVNQPIDALQQLYSQGMAQEAGRLNELIPVLKGADFVAVREWLDSRLNSQGLRRFVCETLPQLSQSVGDGWARGEINVHEEHLFTEQVNNLLRGAIATMPLALPGSPRVLLTTTPGEQHGLGLLMVEVVLRLEGCTVISLGTETPLPDIAAAAQAHQTQVVALSFSIAYSAIQARKDLSILLAILPAGVALWAGGQAIHEQRPLAGVTLMKSLHDVQQCARQLKH